MTKQISEKIAKICGIEPVYKYTFQVFKKKEILFAWGKTEFVRHLNALFYSCDGFRKYYKFIKVEKHYPNWGDPENFVRLLELKYSDNETIAQLLVAGNSSCFLTNREGFLSRLIECLDEKYAGKSLKQAIRAEKWKV